MFRWKLVATSLSILVVLVLQMFSSPTGFWACDISVTSPLNSKILSEAGVTAGAAAHATELQKHEANDVSVVILGGSVSLWQWKHMVWGKEAVKAFSMLASCLATTSSRPKSMVLSELYGRLNLLGLM